jgi:hypothetical protein
MKRIMEGTRFFVFYVEDVQTLEEANNIEDVLRSLPTPEGFEPYLTGHGLNMPTFVTRTLLLEGDKQPDWEGYQELREEVKEKVGIYFPHVVVKLGEAKLVNS